MRGLPRVVAQTPVGKTVDIEYIRKGQKRTAKVMVARLSDEEASLADSAGSDKSEEKKLMGMKLAPLSDQLRKTFTLKDTVKGVVVTEVEAQGPAAQRDLKPGDVIIEAQDEAVRRAMQAAVVSHAQAGRAVAAWRDGHVVWIEPEEILRQFPVRPAVAKQ